MNRSVVVVYGDFTCPYSYLASQRVDALSAAGVADVQWRVVEHDRAAPPGPALLRLRQWRREWRSLPHPHLPAVVRPADGTVVTGPDAVAYLAGLLTRHMVSTTLLG